jgi:hypothetical protein
MWVVGFAGQVDAAIRDQGAQASVPLPQIGQSRVLQVADKQRGALRLRGFVNGRQAR